MNPRLKPTHVWIATVLLHAAQTIYYYPRLPIVVAQHFGADGRANGWASREFFFVLSWVILLGLSAIFMLTPRMLRRIPASMINLPHKQYWPAPERRDESLVFIERQMQWMGVITLVFLVLVIHLAIRANFDVAHHFENGPFLVLLATFVTSNFWLVAGLYRRFPNPAKK